MAARLGWSQRPYIRSLTSSICAASGGSCKFPIWTMSVSWWSWRKWLWYQSLPHPRNTDWATLGTLHTVHRLQKTRSPGEPYGPQWIILYAADLGQYNWTIVVEKNFTALKFSLHTAWRKVKDRTNWHLIADLATMGCICHHTPKIHTLKPEAMQECLQLSSASSL